MNSTRQRASLQVLEDPTKETSTRFASSGKRESLRKLGSFRKTPKYNPKLPDDSLNTK